MDWLHPTYLWALGAAPLAVTLFLWAAWKRREAIRRFGSEVVVARLSMTVSARRRRWKAAAVTGGIVLLALALAGPRFGTELREVRREGIDLVIALDVSQSMQAEDVGPNRLERSKNEIKKLLDELRGDRVGLVIFAGDAFIQCPLTTDYSAVRLFLDVADPTMIPTPGTDFGAAFRMAMQAFQVPTDTPDNEPTRALLFVSDGENHVAAVDELVAEARQEGIVMYAAGVGETEGALIPTTENGRRTGFKQDAQGEPVRTRLEEAVLQQLAGDGAYFRIARTSSSLPRITSSFERLERQEFATEEFEEYDERYQWPLAAALILLMLERLVTDRRKIRSAAATDDS
ncbi:MAG: VWA domain-containing protein [Rhodothermales bacterium]